MGKSDISVFDVGESCAYFDDNFVVVLQIPMLANFRENGFDGMIPTEKTGSFGDRFKNCYG